MLPPGGIIRRFQLRSPVSVIAVAVLLCAGFAYISLVCVRPRKYYTLELSQDGIRQLGPDRYVPWNSVVGLRECRLFQRVDLQCPNGYSGVSIEYQMKQFPEIMRKVLASARCTNRVETREFAAIKSLVRSAVFVLMMLIMTGTGLWGAVVAGNFLAWLALIIFPLALIYDRYTAILSVRVLDDRVIFATAARTREIPFKSIRSVEVVRENARQSNALDVIVQSNTGERIGLRPLGADLFQLYAAIAGARAAA